MQEITKSADPVELVAAPHLEEGAVGEGELVLEAVVNRLDRTSSDGGLGAVELFSHLTLSLTLLVREYPTLSRLLRAVPTLQVRPRLLRLFELLVNLLVLYIES